MTTVNKDNVHTILGNLSEILNSDEFIEYGKLYDRRVISAVESFSKFITKYQDADNLMDSFIAFREMYIVLEEMMGYQIYLSNLIVKKGLEIESVN